MNTATLTAVFATILLVTPSGASAATKPVPAPPGDLPPAQKSVFTIDPETGRDPFFPKSTRLKQQVVIYTNDVAVAPPSFPNEIRCQGFSGTPDRRFALVSNKTVEKGEEFDLTLRTGQRVRVRCVDVKETTVTLEINGVTRELRLRAGL